MRQLRLLKSNVPRVFRFLIRGRLDLAVGVTRHMLRPLRDAIAQWSRSGLRWLFDFARTRPRLYMRLVLPAAFGFLALFTGIFFGPGAGLGALIVAVITAGGLSADVKRVYPFGLPSGEDLEPLLRRLTFCYACFLPLGIGVAVAAHDYSPPGIVIIVLCVVGYAVARHYLVGWNLKPAALFVRGRKLIDYEKANKLAAALPRTNAPDIVWGGLSLPADAALGHFLIAGATGSGKTISLTQLMHGALPLVGRVPDTRALVYDAKQDMMSVLDSLGLEKKAVLFNPFDARSHAWDIAADVTTPALADAVATILFPPDQESQPFFTNSARDLLYAVLISHLRHAPCRWTLRDVLYTLGSKDRLHAVLARDEDTLEIYDTYSQPETTFQNVLSTVRTKARCYETVAAAWSHVPRERTVSLHDWVKGDFILVLGSNEAMRTAIDPINRVIFKRAADLILAGSESTTRRTWIFLDEVAKAGRLQGLDDLLTKGRSKGACVVLGFQDIDSLRRPDLYGEHAANEITGQCANKAFLQLHSHSTAEWAASLVGQVELAEVDRSISRGTNSGGGSGGSSSSSSESFSERTATRHAVMIEEFFTLNTPTAADPRLEGVYLTSRIGAYRARYAFHIPAKGPEPDFVPRPPEEQVLARWDDADRTRLGLNGEAPPRATPAAAASEPAPPLDDFRRLSRDNP